MKDIIIDVREADEFARSHVEGAINVPHGSINETSPELAGIPKDTPLVVYCQSGGRAAVATNNLGNLGYTTVTNGIDQANVESKHM